MMHLHLTSIPHVLQVTNNDLLLSTPLLFGQGFGRYIAFPPTYPQLRCLKQLELELRRIRGENLIFYTPLVRACPLLSTFTVRVSLLTLLCALFFVLFLFCYGQCALHYELNLLIC